MLENLTAKPWVFMYAFHSWQDDGGHVFNENVKTIIKTPMLFKRPPRPDPKLILKAEADERYNRGNL